MEPGEEHPCSGVTRATDVDTVRPAHLTHAQWKECGLIRQVLLLSTVVSKELSSTFRMITWMASSDILPWLRHSHSDPNSEKGMRWKSAIKTSDGYQVYDTGSVPFLLPWGFLGHQNFLLCWLASFTNITVTIYFLFLPFFLANEVSSPSNYKHMQLYG